MKAVIILSIVIFSYSCSFAQSYIPGKVFKASDTLKGFIKEQIDKHNSRECLFKASLSEKPVGFGAAQITGYELENGKRYKSALIKTDTTSEHVFLQILTEGELNSYFLRQKGLPDRFFLEKNSSKMLEISGGKEIEVQGTRHYYEGNYKELLSSALQDCETKKFNLSKLRYDRKDIANVVWEYNLCKRRDVYHYVTKSNIVWGLKAGYYPIVATATPSIPAYNLQSAKQNSMGLQLGLFISDQILDVDKKLFLQAEAQFMNFQFNNFLNSDIKMSMLSLPVSFKYYILSTKCSPYIEGGAFFNFNLSSSSSNQSFDKNNINSGDSNFLYGAGVRWRLSKSELSLGYRHQKFHVSTHPSTYIVEVTGHMITLAFGF